MYYYILNPAAGRGTVGQIEQRLRERLKELGISGEFVKTTGAGDATQMAHAAITKGYNTIVAVGGDGTVNEVINGIKKEGVAVGIIPAGKHNLLAKKLGIYNWQQAADLLASRRLTPISLMASGQHYFLSSLAIGFPADLDKHVETGVKGLKARLFQVKNTLSHTRSFEEIDCQLQLDDNVRVRAKIFYLWITNRKFQNPGAANKLIISFSDRPGKKQLSSLLWQIMTGRQPNDDSFTSRLQADRVVIDTKPGTPIMIDGKLSGRTPVAVRLTTKRIRFICSKEMAK